MTIARTTVAHNNVGLNANGSVAGILHRLLGCSTTPPA